MNMERFVEELKQGAGPYGEKAWSIVETWYTRDGRARRLSLHDLHELSKAIADALKDAAAPELYEALKWIATVNAMDYEYQRIARAALAKVEERK